MISFLVTAASNANAFTYTRNTTICQKETKSSFLPFLKSWETTKFPSFSRNCRLVHRDFDRSYSCHKQYWQKQVFLFSYILQVLSISVKNTVKDRILIQSSDLNFTDLTMNFSWKSKLIYLHFALKYPDISRKFLCQKFLKGWQMKWSLYLVLCTEGCSSARSS